MDLIENKGRLVLNKTKNGYFTSDDVLYWAEQNKEFPLEMWWKGKKQPRAGEMEIIDKPQFTTQVVTEKNVYVHADYSL